MKKTPIIPLFDNKEDEEELKEYDKMVTVHIKVMEKKYGKKRSNIANIGWFSDSDSITSKVYGDKKHPTEIFTTERIKKGNKITYRHSRETYIPSW